jgi:D-amino-acid dehydrogenase
MKIIILGAGVIGVTTAYFLSRAGHEVLVIDKAAGAGLSASFANGGQLSYAYSDSLANPTMLPKLPGLLLGFEPAFDIKLSADPALLSWGLRFLRNCTKARAAFNTKNILRLALYSRLKLHQILAHQTIRFNYQQNGKLLMYINKKDFLRAAKQMEIKNQWGSQQQVLTQAECLAKEPALKSIANNIVGGIFSPLDESGDAYLFTTALAKLCTASGKVQFFYNTEIKRLVVDKGRISYIKTADNHYSADAFVMCLGADSPLLSRTIGLKLPIYPLKGYSITVPATPAAPSINITDVHHKIVYSTLGDNLRYIFVNKCCHSLTCPEGEVSLKDLKTS